jgi:hypothetical protein
MIDKNNIKPNTKVYGLYKTTHSCNYKRVALNCFFLNPIDALELKEYLVDRGEFAYYTSLDSTYGQIFQGGITYNGAKPILYESIREYFEKSMENDGKDM